jgi:hypothetical protein
MRIPERVYERVIHWADRDLDTGCLASRYSTGSHGYAQIGWVEDGERIVTLCHLALWRYLDGEPPDGMTVDHTCKNRRCVERKHLRLLTNFDNARRTSGRDWPLGQCIAGHDDRYLHTQPNGRTRCTICRAEYQRRYRAKKEGRTMKEKTT